MTAAALLRVYIPAAEAGMDVLGLPEASPEAAPTWRIGEFGIVAETLVEDAVFVDYRGQRYVCPRRPRLRMLESVLAFHNGFSGLGGDIIVPEASAVRAAEELERLREHSGRSQILTSQWHVPLRWFVLFHPDEKLIGLAGPSPELKYRTTRTEATVRLQRSVKALRAAGMAMVTGELEQLLDWIGGFPENWLVELDYASVTALFSEEDLLFDATCEELWQSIEALENLDPMEAHRWYEQAAGRWAPAMMITYAN
jgi:hypothetical protein